MQLNPDYTYINPALAGQTMYIRVWNYNNKDGGIFSLCVWEPPVPSNNSCANAITIPCGTSCSMNTFTNAYATADPVGTAPDPSCGFYQGGDVWFKFVAPASGKMEFEAFGVSGCNPQYAIYNGTCGSFTQVYCGQLNEQHTYVDPALGGQTLYMRVWNYNSEEGGTFRICVWEPPVPSNDNCAGAIPLNVGTSCLLADGSSKYATSQSTSVAPNPTCGFYAGGDVWYTILMPASGNLTLQFTNLSGNAQYAVYTGTCGAFTQIACQQLNPTLNISNPSLGGQTLYLRVWDFNSEDGGTYRLCSYDPSPPPTITCPPAVTVQCSAAVPAHDFAGGSATASCGTATVTWVSDVISNQTCPNKYTITRTYRATDGCNSSSTCTQTITVNDNTAPLINCPADITVQCGSEIPAHNFSGGSASDNCGTVTVTWLGDVISNSTCPNRYIVHRSYQATDACGNSTNCVQTITVNDTTPPTISCPPPVTVQCGTALPAHDFAGGSVSDNCGGNITVTWVSDAVVSSICTHKYTIYRTYRATDACGNVATCSQIITVDDNTPPIIACPPNVTVQCSSAMPPHDFAGGTASDNCGLVTVAWINDQIVNQTCANKYTINRNYKATDECGNSTSCTQVITVNDDSAPTITCPPPITVQCSSAVPAHDFAGGSASDNCGNVTVTWISDNIVNQTCQHKYSIQRVYR
ncbi:MAG TPA: hypothetical protein VKH37_13360, partial [Ferruginibacter sp.]|nr:hypothetical protein [Ferruginibacter sp.]